jgi:hypothetical protein
MTTPATVHEPFERTAQMPVMWRLTADQLLRASRALVSLIEADNRAMNDPSQQVFESSVECATGVTPHC